MTKDTLKNTSKACPETAAKPEPDVEQHDTLWAFDAWLALDMFKCEAPFAENPQTKTTSQQTTMVTEI